MTQSVAVHRRTRAWRFRERLRNAQPDSRLVARLCGLGLLSATVAAAPTVSAPQDADVLTVNDPRPLNAAIALLEQRCRCIITYEDPKWGPADLVDISGTVQHRADVRPRIPKGGAFSFRMAADGSARTAAEVRPTVERVIRAFHDSASGRGHFQLIGGADALHVVPQLGSILDQPVTIAQGTHPIAEIIAMTLEQVGDAIGQKVGVAALPMNLLKKRVRTEARGESARGVLTRALSASGRPLSWRIFHGAGMSQYYFSIHSVH